MFAKRELFWLRRLKNNLPRSSLDALYQFAELAQTPEFKTGQKAVRHYETAIRDIQVQVQYMYYTVSVSLVFENC
jgi:hypothetical protein